MKNFIITAMLIVGSVTNMLAQKAEKKQLLYSNKFSILAGMIQPMVLRGGNIEFNYFTKRMSFDYSHGFSLDPPVAGDYKEQNLALHLPFSTGFGVGYRFTSSFDVRFEPKLHSWEVYDKDTEQTDPNRLADFKTFTLGVGMYYRYFPFKNKESKILQGITTSTSLRWWQNVGTTLRNDEFTYFNKSTAKNETLKAPNIGIANSPIIFNIGIGYTFGGK
jgi:hypothetical protein